MECHGGIGEVFGERGGELNPQHRVDECADNLGGCRSSVSDLCRSLSGKCGALKALVKFRAVECPDGIVAGEQWLCRIVLVKSFPCMGISVG